MGNTFSAVQSRSLWGWLMGAVLLAALLMAVHNTVGWHETLAAWKQLPLNVLVAACSLLVASHALRAYRIFEYNRSDFSGVYTTALKISSFHQLANNLLPMRMGEAAYPLLMRRYANTHWMEGSVRLLFLRVLDLWVAGSVFFGVILTLLMKQPWISVSITVAMILLVFTVWIRVLLPALSRGPLPQWLLGVQARWTLADHVIQNLQVACSQSTRINLRMILWTWLAWGCKLFAYSVLLAAMTDLSPVTALSAAFTGEMSSLLPIHGVAGAGTFEAAFVLGAQVQTTSLNAVIAAAVNIHVFVLAISVLMALLSLPIRVKRPN